MLGLILMFNLDLGLISTKCIYMQQGPGTLAKLIVPTRTTTNFFLKLLMGASFLKEYLPNYQSRVKPFI